MGIVLFTPVVPYQEYLYPQGVRGQIVEKLN